VPGERSLWELADLVTPMALRVAATLRIADRIAQGTNTAPALAAAAGADADAFERLLRHLVTAGVLSHGDAREYGVTPLGEALRDDHPSGLRERLDIEGAVGHADLAFACLSHSIRTGESAFPLQFGRSFWDDLAANPARSASFDAQMGVDAAAWARDVVGAYDWGALGRLVDVGGGNGAMLIALLQAHPALRGTVFDLPATATTARAALAAAGLQARGDAVGGSFFEPLPAGADGYLLSAILHDWPDAAALAILRRCAEAAGAAGKVFVLEKIGADGKSLQTAMDLRMLAFFGGKERGVAELAALGAEAGLKLAAVHPAGPLAIVEFRAA